MKPETRNIRAFGTSCAVTAPAPRLNLETCQTFEKEVRAHLPVGCNRIDIDMAHTEFVDSSGIGTLVALRKSVGSDGVVSLINPTEFVRRVLKLTRMHSVFDIQPPLD